MEPRGVAASTISLHGYTLACPDCGAVMSIVVKGEDVTGARCWRCRKDISITREVSVTLDADSASAFVQGGSP